MSTVTYLMMQGHTVHKLMVKTLSGVIQSTRKSVQWQVTW